MKVLWAPWRMKLISAPKQKGCIFCDLPRRPELRDNLVLAATPTSLVMLNRYPYNSGHVLVAPRRHLADLERLTPIETSDLMDTLRHAIAVVRRELRPEGLNVGMNLGAVAGAGIADHLHWHVVPRWGGDTNFMPVLGATKVIPEHLLDTYDRLRPRFAGLVSSRRRPAKRRRR